MTLLQLSPASDADFAWLLAPHTAHPGGLTVAPGGLETESTLRRLRGLAETLRRQHPPGAWLMVQGPEIVGLIGYKLAPDSEGRVEFGYGLAESRRRLGFGTQAVAALVRDATEDSDIRLLYAETLVGNIGSQKVLRANGFHQSATREDAEDGALLCWSRAV
ncbi:GNAT family N-acetyltransferase [Elstera sp.]|uniref:GNAT family N-acetyltransferase n=1 Tax=Elstera sp. TaxID=1916664 RepID=UPI0037BE7642